MIFLGAAQSIWTSDCHDLDEHFTLALTLLQCSSDHQGEQHAHTSAQRDQCDVECTTYKDIEHVCHGVNGSSQSEVELAANSIIETG